MIKNNESFDNLINYFDSEQYKQLLKGFISVSETAESLLDKFSFNILDSMTSALINISKSFEQRQSKILFDSLEILKNVPLDSLDWNSSSNREVQLDDKSVERVSDVLDTVIPDDVPKKKSLEETLKKHQATTAFIFGLLMLLLEIYSVFFKHLSKFVISSMSATVIDFAIYAIMLNAVFGYTEENTSFLDNLTDYRIVISFIVARILSSAFNFIINKYVVFKERKRNPKEVAKYYAIVVVVFLCTVLLNSFFLTIGVAQWLCQPLATFIMFFISYYFQRVIVFK